MKTGVLGWNRTNDYIVLQTIAFPFDHEDKKLVAGMIIEIT